MDRWTLTYRKGQEAVSGVQWCNMRVPMKGSKGVLVDNTYELHFFGFTLFVLFVVVGGDRDNILVSLFRKID